MLFSIFLLTLAYFIKDPPPLSTKTKSVPSNKESPKKDNTVPLAERMRPLSLNDIVGQKDAFGPGSMLRSMLEQKKIPNMILWGPPGCGKVIY